jgi:hypothetical protein
VRPPEPICPTCRNGPPTPCPRPSCGGRVFHEPPIGRFLGEALSRHACVLCGREPEGPLGRGEVEGRGRG